jgi:hypothetical protein
MGILDEAIREHLELKRQHGAADDELKQLEDEAFGPAERPRAEPASDAQSEAPTEFMPVPGAGEKPQRQEPSVADLQEAPPGPEPAEREQEGEPAAEEDRQVIAEQPTEHFDVEEELAATADSASPTDEELVEKELEEPRLAPVDPLASVEAVEEVAVEPAPEVEPDDDEDDEFWSDQRLSEELDQALDAPLPEEADEPSEEEPAPPAAEGQTAGEQDAPAPSAAQSGDHDVLEETPEFLEDAPEDDELWFEQKPPKDFDFDD